MGVLANARDAVTLVNRTIGAGDQERDLNVRYDGEDLTLKPGENPGFPLIAVRFAKVQNPLMGSVHPVNPNKFISLVGVKGSKDDITPIPRDVLLRASTKLESVDRNGEHWRRPMRQNVKVLNEGFEPYEAMADAGATTMDSNAGLDRRLG